MIKRKIEKILKLDRYKIFSGAVFLLLLVMSMKLFHMTIVRGNHYRDLSENKRLKDIIITAPRGEIRDRNGILIAGNRPVFTVQLLKDEIERQETEEKNNGFLKLVRYIEEDGVSYIDELPLDLNVFKFESQSDYLNSDESPTDVVTNTIIENQLFPELLDTYFKPAQYPNHYSFFTINRLINALDTTGNGIPIKLELKNSSISLEFVEGDQTRDWKLQHNIEDEITPKEAIMKLAENNETYVKKILDHPISRKLAYELLVSKGLEDGIILEEYSNKYYNNYFNNKIALMKRYPQINLQSSAKEDFINVFKSESLRNLLLAEVDESQEEFTFPGEVLLEIINSKYEENPVAVQLSGLIPSYYFEENPERDAFNYVVERASESDIMNEYLNNSDIAYMAQAQMIKDGINTGISISKEDFEYVNLINYNDWLLKFGLDKGLSDEEIFKKLCDHYEISSDISPYEARGIMNLYNEIDKQGNLGYIPINFAYKIKDSTVARISENLSKNTGINISSEPIRHYPLGDSSAHILGYIGKIAQDWEVEEYIENKGYERNALIGKTGIEQTYETYLKGENGKRRVEVDNIGNTTKVLSEVKPIPGNNVYLSIDIILQQKAEQTLERVLELIRTGGTYESEWGDFTFTTSKDKGRPYIHATSGAVMVVDVKTGKILTMANFPSYDPNLFSTGISTVDWESMIPEEEEDPLAPRPLYNIPLQTAVQPGSVYKMITALTALEKGMSPTEEIMDGGYVTVDDAEFSGILWKEQQRSYGLVNMYDAIKDSVNYYFYSLALGKDQRRNVDIGVQISTEEIAAIARKFGLDSETGIEINTPAEAKSTLPDPATKTATIKQLLKNHLINNIDTYYIGEEELTEEKKSSIIDSVLELVDLREIPTRQETMEVLTSLELDTEKRAPNASKGLGDLVKYDYLNQSKWNMADTLNVTIGQGANSYTLAQITRYVMTMVNGGYNYNLSIVRDILDYENKNLILDRPVEGNRIGLSDYNNLNHLMEGMRRASTSGINTNVFSDFPIEVGIKTGTAERSGENPYTKDTYDSFSWEVGFAPYDNPEIAVACVFFQGGPGSNASPLIREIVAQYFGLNNKQETNTLPIETRLEP